MDLIHDENGQKKIYAIRTTSDYRVSGMKNNAIGDSECIVTSAVITLETGTLITIDKLNINKSRPEMIRAYMPGAEVYITAISLSDITPMSLYNEW